MLCFYLSWFSPVFADCAVADRTWAECAERLTSPTHPHSGPCGFQRERAWKDLEGPGRTVRVRKSGARPRPGWLAAPLILVRFLPTRFATVAFFLLGWEWLASRLAAVPGTRPRSQRSG